MTTLQNFLNSHNLAELGVKQSDLEEVVNKVSYQSSIPSSGGGGGQIYPKTLKYLIAHLFNLTSASEKNLKILFLNTFFNYDKTKLFDLLCFSMSIF